MFGRKNDHEVFMNLRVGIGFDVHAFAADRDLILGGIKIPFHLGLSGHSDADVLAHAIIDALLGAAGLGDIGTHFSDKDPQYKGISSLILLAHVKDMLAKNNFEIVNIDTVVICQQPRIGPYRSQMQNALAKTLVVNPEKIHIKATTTEKLGFTGRGEGIAVEAICLLDKKAMKNH